MPGSTNGAPTSSEALARLERSERGLRRLIMDAAHPTLLVGYDGDIVLANTAVEALLGHPAADLPGTPVELLLAPSSRRAHRERREGFATAPPVGPVGSVRADVLTRHGLSVPVEIGLSGLETADGVMMCATLRDVSEELLRGRQDAALRRVAAATAAGPPEGLLAMVVEEAARLLRADRALVARFDPGAIVVVGCHGDRRSHVGDVISPDGGTALAAVGRTGDVARIAYADLPPGDPARESALREGRRHAVGVPISVHTRLWGGLMVAAADPATAQEVDALARFAELAGALLAAAQTRSAERALRDSEERFRAMADFIPQLLWTCDAAGDCDFANLRWTEYTGLSAERLLGRGWLEAVHPDDRPALVAAWETARGRAEPFAADCRILRRDGAYRRFDTRAAPQLDDAGAIVKWFGSNTDVEGTRAASEAVRASEAQLRAALDAGRMGAWTFHPEDGLRVDANVRALFAIPPDTPDDAVREAMASRVHPNDRDRVTDAFARTLASAATEHHIEFRAVLPDGAKRHVEAHGQVTRDASGAPGVFTGVMVDVTEQRQAGERLLRSQKLEALGTLSGGIAHDFNNLLQVIGGNVAIARAELPAASGAQEPLSVVERATQRAADLVDRILAFSRPDGAAAREPVALGPLVEDALDLLRPTLPAMIALRCTIDDDLPCVSGDRAGITQIVTNLATNAAQAIGRTTGSIEFRLEAVTLAAEEIQGVPGLDAGAYVRLTVSDDGPGMDAATAARIFDPFFTTKDPGVGTGLGLSIVHSLMRAHDGTVTVYSVPGTGTSFRLYFPVGRPGAPQAVAPAAPPAPAGRPGRILFVDDEADLVALHERSLGRVGHTVVGHTDPRVALEAFRAGPDAFDAVVTDLSMPGMTGLDLARAILAVRPDMPILIATGYIPSDEQAEADALGIREVLPKPSPIARLRDALATALEG